METCADFREPSRLNFVLSLTLAIGIVVSYLPQHLRIVQRRSSEGISPWFLLLGVTSGTCALCNILLLASPIVNCCSKVSKYECFSSTLGIVQISLQALMAGLILVLAVTCVDVPPAVDEPVLTSTGVAATTHDDYVKIVTVAKVCSAHFVLSAAWSIITALYYPHHVSFTADIMGLLAAALATVQYLPQIYMTATLRHAGSLSIPMMCMQTPGGFVWAATLAARPGTAWSSWLPYLTAACLQCVLLIMASFFELTRKVGPSDTVEPTETAPLLASD